MSGGQNTHVLTLAFYRPTPGEHRMNDLTARFSEHGLCHVELVFHDMWAFSLYLTEPTRLRQKSFLNPGYEMVSLSVPHMEYAACLQFCQAAAKEAYPIDMAGMYLSTVHPGGCMEVSSAARGKTFCSKIITEALKFGGLQEVSGLSPSAVTPSRLYAAVKDSERRVCHAIRPLRQGGAGAIPAHATMR